MGRILLILLIIVLSFASTAVAVQVAPRISDREIIEALAAIRGDIKNLQGNIQYLREEIKDVRAEIKDVRGEIKDVRGEIKEVRGDIKWGFGILFSGMLILMGFILWDRRTTLAPVVREMKETGAEIEELKKQIKESTIREKELEQKERLIERIMRDYAARVPEFAETMRVAGLL